VSATIQGGRTIWVRGSEVAILGREFNSTRRVDHFKEEDVLDSHGFKTGVARTLVGTVESRLILHTRPQTIPVVPGRRSY
jgi:hypothetical protein